MKAESQRTPAIGKATEPEYDDSIFEEILREAEEEAKAAAAEAKRTRPIQIARFKV